MNKYDQQVVKSISRQKYKELFSWDSHRGCIIYVIIEIQNEEMIMFCETFTDFVFATKNVMGTFCTITMTNNTNAPMASLHWNSNVHGANMGPTWALSAPDGSHAGPMNLTIRDVNPSFYEYINTYTYVLFYRPQRNSITQVTSVTSTRFWRLLSAHLYHHHSPQS